MIDEIIKKTLDKVSEPTDISTILLAGVIGGVIDAASNPFGFFTWQETAIVCASGALGVKMGAPGVANVAKWIKRKVQKQEPDKETIEKAEKLIKIINNDDNDKRRQAIAQRLRSDLELFHSDFIEANDLKAGVDQAIKAYRDHSQNTEGSV